MFKKLGMIVLSITMFLTLIPTTTFAANVEDKKFKFTINSNAYKYTSARAKENSSSTYVHVKEVPAVYIRTNVQGFRPISGTNYWRNETIGGQISLRKGQWLIKQLVYENGGRSARLQLQKHSTNGTVSGVWSPDSVGSYPYAN